MAGSKRLQNLLLNRCASGHLFIHHFEGDEVHRAGYIRLIFDNDVEEKQPVMGIQSSKKKLHAEMPRTDVLNRSLIMLVDGLHHQLHKYRRLVAQFLEVDVGTIAR